MLAPSIPERPAEEVRAATAGNPDADDPWDAWFGVEEDDKGAEPEDGIPVTRSDDVPTVRAVPDHRPGRVQGRRTSQPVMRNLLETEDRGSALGGSPPSPPRRMTTLDGMQGTHLPPQGPNGTAGVALPVQSDIWEQMIEDTRVASDKVKASATNVSKQMSAAANRFRAQFGRSLF
jgi:hypothetical protein